MKPLIHQFTLENVSKKPFEAVEDQATHVDLSSGVRYAVPPEDLASFLVSHPNCAELLTPTFHFFFDVDLVDDVFLSAVLDRLWNQHKIELIVALKAEITRIIVPDLVLDQDQALKKWKDMKGFCQRSPSTKILQPTYGGELKCSCPVTVTYVGLTPPTELDSRHLSIRVPSEENAARGLVALARAQSPTSQDSEPAKAPVRRRVTRSGISSLPAVPVPVPLPVPSVSVPSVPKPTAATKHAEPAPKRQKVEITKKIGPHFARVLVPHPLYCFGVDFEDKNLVLISTEPLAKEQNSQTFAWLPAHRLLEVIDREDEIPLPFDKDYWPNNAPDEAHAIITKSGRLFTFSNGQNTQSFEDWLKFVQTCRLKHESQ